MAEPKASNLKLKPPTNMTLSERFVDGFKQPKVRIYIWEVNGSQNEVLVVRKVNVKHQGFVIGYDIEIYVTVFFIDNWPCFTRKATPPLAPVERSFFSVS